MRAKAPDRPTSVRIFGRTFSIEYQQPTALMAQAVGLCVGSEQRIFAADWQTPIEEVDTVFHETLHGILGVMQVGLDPETEEKAVSAIASGVVGVLQDNPEYAEWLIARRTP